jgi:two-component system nitrogen regulation response regulator GlnG
MQKSARDLGVEPKRMSEAALKYISAQDLPGNVRQLENICHWLTVMAPAANIEVKDLPPEMRAVTTASTSKGWVAELATEAELRLHRGETSIMTELTQQFETILIRKALDHTGGRRIEAAQLLGLGRNTLTRKIQELQIDGARTVDEA